MANVSPRRWTETLQIRVAPGFKEILTRVANDRGMTPSEAVRALVEEADAKIAKAKRRDRAGSDASAR